MGAKIGCSFPCLRESEMTPLGITLLVVGLIFPALSLFTEMASLWDRWRHQKHSSPVFIPFIGPILLTSWVLIDHNPLWWIPFVWIADIGTMAFLVISPRLIADWWHISSFTRILTLRGDHDIQSAIITLHSSGHYLLKKSWNRPPGQIGIVALGEPGTFIQTENQYELTSDLGLHRILRKTLEGTYRVEQDQRDNESLQNYLLHGWVFKS